MGYSDSGVDRKTGRLSKFRVVAEKERDSLSLRGLRGSRSFLLVNQKKKNAIIGIQTNYWVDAMGNESGLWHNTIYFVCKKNGEITRKTILDEEYCQDFIRPNDFSKNGKVVGCLRIKNFGNVRYQNSTRFDIVI